jgi:hypothetical protein
MDKTNFFITDLMRTGNPNNVRQFILSNSLSEQTITTNEYYEVFKQDIQRFDRKIAFIDFAISLDLPHNDIYWRDLNARCEILNGFGFNFILSYPWESHINMSSTRKIDIMEKFKYKFMKWAGGENWFWNMMYHRYKEHNFKFDHDVKKFDFLYLNKKPRSHRNRLFDLASEAGLLTNSLYSFTSKMPRISLDPDYELPWVDRNNYPLYGFDRDIFELPYNHSVCSLVSETHDTGDDFITEKTWKPIIAEQVFVIHSKAHCLAKLRQLGFKTFGDFIDESYDEEVDNSARMNKIIKTCLDIKKMDPKRLYHQTESIRAHNRNTFFDYRVLNQSVNKTLLGFFEFVDSSKVSL